MSDKQMVERVKLLLSRSAVDNATTIYPVISPGRQQPAAVDHVLGPAVVPDNAATAVLPAEALQVLTLAQRTAEDHIAAAKRHAGEARELAQVLAEQTQREAQAYADQMRAEADKLLITARSDAELANRDAHTQAAELQRQAGLLLADARAEAEQIVAGGHQQAEQLKIQAKHRYEDAVGGLATKRAELQNQVEALEVFNAEYRSRLTSFMQGQLRALWADHPQVGEVEGGSQLPGGPVERRDDC